MIIASLVLLPSLVAAAPAKKKSTPRPLVAKDTETYSLPLYPPTTAPITVPLVIERFTEFDGKLKSMTCEFSQAVRWEQSGVAQNVEGSLEYRKPELIHIEQKQPEPQTMVSDGAWLWIWRKSTNQVIQTKLEDWKRSEPLAQGLLDFGNYADMLRKYDVSISTIGAPDAGGYRELELALRPKERSKSGEFVLRLRLTTKDFFPDETNLEAGQVVVRSSFKNIRYNPPIKDERFQFTPPAGADVFENFKPPKPE